MTNLERRLTKLEAHFTDVSGLVPQTQKWLEYWQAWFDRPMDGPDGRRGELMPHEALRAVLAAWPDSE
jgi:hypothetical protein